LTLDREEESRVPRHVAIIADGNRRWARSRGLVPIAGHEAGADALSARVADALELGVRELTVFSFSTENWSRPAAQVRGLIAMLAQRIVSEAPALDRQGVRMHFIGRRAGVDHVLVKAMHWAEALTAANNALVLFIALNYGARAEILDAARRFVGDSEQDFRACLYAPQLNDPDVVIRTGGESRMSNYLLWQAAYAELVFRDELWPDFSREVFEQCLAEFRLRKGRLGGR
jgi:undecaprenyl diphosphate synthase